MRFAGAGPRIHHWGLEVTNKDIFADTIKEAGGKILSKPGAGALKFRAPDGTVAEIVAPGRYEKHKAEERDQFRNQTLLRILRAP